jgi:hypothetical protein
MMPRNVQGGNRADEDGQADVWVQKSIRRLPPSSTAHSCTLYSIVITRVFSLCVVAICASAPAVIAYPIVEHPGSLVLHIF